jgi:type I restriction enzyme, S subunit
MSWPLRPVSELCEFAVDCVNKTAPVVDQETPYKMIRTTNVKGGFIDIQDVRRVTRDTFEKWTRRSRPRYGDVVLTREAPVGEVGRCTFSEDEYIFLGQRLFHYRPDPEKLDWNFLAYVLQSPEVQGRFHGRSFGATVPHVKVGDAESLLIPCPPLDEQRRIGRVLANYDDLIATNLRRIALLEDAVRRIYREWFVHLRFPGHESVPVKDGTPEGWQPATFAELVKINPRTPFPKDVERPFVEMSALSEKSMVIGQRSTRVLGGGAKFKNGDTLFARITPCTENGKTGFVQFLDNDVDVAGGSTEFIVLRSAAVNPWWVYCLAREENFREHAIRSMAGSDGRQRVNTKCFDQFLTLQPSPLVLSQFEQAVKDSFAQIEILCSLNEQLAQARDLLLPKLMCGELDVSGIPLPEEIEAMPGFVAPRTEECIRALDVAEA